MGLFQNGGKYHLSKSYRIDLIQTGLNRSKPTFGRHPLYGKVHTEYSNQQQNSTLSMWSYSSLYYTIWLPNIVKKLENFYNNYATFDLMSVCKVRPHLLTCAFMLVYFCLVYSFTDLRQKMDYYIILDIDNATRPSIENSLQTEKTMHNFSSTCFRCIILFICNGTTTNCSYDKKHSIFIS